MGITKCCKNCVWRGAFKADWSEEGNENPDNPLVPICRNSDSSHFLKEIKLSGGCERNEIPKALIEAEKKRKPWKVI